MKEMTTSISVSQASQACRKSLELQVAAIEQKAAARYLLWQMKTLRHQAQAQLEELKRVHL
jgi:hypothetical protein